MRKAWLLGCVAGGVLGCSVQVDETVDTSRDEVIWNDSLLEYSSLNATEKLRANATAILVDKGKVTNCNASFCTMATVQTLLCPNAPRLLDQRAIGSACTVFMVGPKQLATAGHCFSAEAFGVGACPQTSVVFHWRKDSAAAANTNILREHIYNCQTELFNGLPDGEDWSVIEVDRNISTSDVTPRSPMKLARSKSALNTIIDVPHHFAAVPIKYNVGKIVSQDPLPTPFLRAEIDVTNGSSGSPWIDRATGVVQAITARGPGETLKREPLPDCVIEKDCRSGQCSGTDRPGGTPATSVPRGPRGFVTGTSLTRPTDTAMIGDFDGDGTSDVYWYAAGVTPELLWFGNANRSFTTFDPGPTNGTYTTRIADFDGDKKSDVLWYRPGNATDVVSYGRDRTGFNEFNVVQSGTFVPVVGDFDGDGKSDILWHGAGVAQQVWYGSSTQSNFTQTTQGTLSASYTPLVGDFDGDGRSDIYWYAAGATAEVIWYGRTNRTFSVITPAPTNGTYVTATADFNGDGISDILWYRPGNGSEVLSYGQPNRTFIEPTLPAVGGTYTLMIGRFDGSAKSDIFWHRPANAVIPGWWGRAGSPVAVAGTTSLSDGTTRFEDRDINTISSDAPLGVGDFDNDGLDDVLLKVGTQATPIYGKRWSD